jgi:3-hydroxyacyl-[acyl-carrier-protein] dehydratase
MLDINEVLEYLPHRYPMLLIDRVLDLEEGKTITALKNVTMNEAFFQGHFPGNPIMPGVLTVEAMAQAAGILGMKTLKVKNVNVYFMSIEKAKFRKPVVPGDQLRFDVSITKTRGKIFKFEGKAFVGDAIVSEAESLTRAFLSVRSALSGRR